MSYCLYLRKSRADIEAEVRGEGETLARHERTLLELAARMNIEIRPKHIFREIVSGDTIADRPVVQRLLHEVEADLWEGVFVMEVERLARGETIDQGIVAQAFRYTGTRIITPYKIYDPADDMDEEFFEFGLFMARREYKTIKRRLQAGRVASVKEGHYLGTRMPYGYKKLIDKGGKGHSLEIVPEKAAIVRSMFQWYASGIGATTIANRLNDMGITTDLGNPWDGCKIRYLLQNPIYIGMVQWNKRKQAISIVNGERIKTRPKSDQYMCVKGQHEAIIDMDTWNRVQAIFHSRERRPIHENKKIENPLAGLVYCGVCGKSMVRRKGTGGRRDFLRCTTPKCTIVTTYIHIVEDAVVETLRTWVKDYAPAPSKRKMEPRADAEAVQVARNQQLELIKTLNMQKGRLYDLLERGIYSDEEYLSRSAELAGRIEEAEKLLSSLVIPQSTEEVIHVLIPQVRIVLTAYKKAKTPEQKNVLLKGVIEKIIYNKSVKCNRAGNPADHISLEIFPVIPEK